ncbi:molybdate ABC transporter substrate-binding protein [Noviherbaspirillum massiliense]|uniref:molybdate ABC transporter substrate-binding protein n=1 Tax=Noviherbaspirillum massiliense TaxID=1465823 RepID=UPI00030A0572|nr:molybdate ABC transporter substrate-binding protein [Noviherbaspirillum massiliense]
MQGAVLLACLFAFGQPSLAASLTVAVSANMQYVFRDLQDAFKKESGHELRPAYNSSGKFAAQILNGAPFDVFLSADMEFPEKLHQAGLATSPPKVYAYGTLVLWTMKDLDLRNWQGLLSSPAVGKIALPNPKTAPYGREAVKALDRLRLAEALRPKLVYAESIAQTNQYIHSGVADAGFTAKSVVLSPEMRGQGKWIELPRDSYQPIAQGAVILKHGEQMQADSARQFYEFLFSGTARAIFARYGYALP